MSKFRWAGLVGVAALASLAGGCAVYSTPSGDVIGPAPVVVSPPAVVVSPSGYYGGYYRSPRYRYGPRYSGPRYYGRAVLPLLTPLDTFLGQPAVTLATAGGDRATVLLHGAQVVSWIPAGGSERLYLSERSRYGDGKGVRGGVPVVFPQFNRRGPDFSLPKHGFVRTRAWTLG